VRPGSESGRRDDATASGHVAVTPRVVADPAPRESPRERADLLVATGEPQALGHPRGTTAGDRDLDRADLPPPTAPGRTRQIYPR